MFGGSLCCMPLGLRTAQSLHPLWARIRDTAHLELRNSARVNCSYRVHSPWGESVLFVYQSRLFMHELGSEKRMMVYHKNANLQDCITEGISVTASSFPFLSLTPLAEVWSSLYCTYWFLLCLGKSALCIEPNALFPFDLSNENSLHQRDIYLQKCHHHLLKFISAYGPGGHVNTNEEWSKARSSTMWNFCSFSYCFFSHVFYSSSLKTLQPLF